MWIHNKGYVFWNRMNSLFEQWKCECKPNIYVFGTELILFLNSEVWMQTQDMCFRTRRKAKSEIDNQRLISRGASLDLITDWQNRSRLTTKLWQNYFPLTLISFLIITIGLILWYPLFVPNISHKYYVLTIVLHLL